MDKRPGNLTARESSTVTAARVKRASARAAPFWQAKLNGPDEIGPSGAKDASGAKLLEWIWPFSELPSAVLKELASRMRERQFGGGDKMIHQGRRSRHLMIMLDGTAEVHVREGSRRHVIAKLHRNAIVGEMGLLTNAPCTATVTAIGTVRVAAISAKHFRRLAVRYPILGSSLGHLVASRLGQAPIDTLAGKVLHGYRLHRCVGRGGMGIVYEAKRVADGQRVALKMLSHRFAYDFEVQQRFDREIQICRSLQHPNIAQILDHFTGFGTNFMVMEFCGGVTLNEFIELHGPLAENQVRGMVGQLAAALAYIHGNGVCHRDVKPRNIMVLDEQGTIRVMDFGLATSVASCELTQCGCVLGTPRYMPPEQLAGQRVDYRADLFALGCVVYEMLTGNALFDNKDITSQLARPFDWSLPPADQIRPGLSAELYRFLRQTTAINPAKRITDLEEIARCWLQQTGPP